MKIYKMEAATIIFFLGMLILSVNAGAQEKLTREEKKEARKAQLAYNYHIIDSLLMTRKFVLEADWLRDKYGNQVNVPSGINFVRVDGENGVLQTGTSSGIGSNGVGGETAEGSVDNWRITKNFKNMNFTVEFHILSRIGNFQIFLTVNAENIANATISGNGPGKLTWSGHLNTLNNSTVFKGQNTY